MDRVKVGKWPQQIVAVTTVVWCLVNSSSPQTERQSDSPAPNILSRYPGQDDYISPTRTVWAVVGGTANLPCNLTSPLRDDPAMLVLWYKQGIHKPIYSYDMRNGPATHWKHPSHLGTRADFVAKTAFLTINRVHVSDEGIYRCRVDFRINPTLTFTTNLTVLEPPESLVVLTEDDDEAPRVVGPFFEGQNLRFTCRATGGIPVPRVTWWEGELLLDTTSEYEIAGEVANTLLLQDLARRDFQRSLTCQATNSNLTSPLTVNITIDMELAPLWVRILNPRSSLSAGRPYDILCRSAGARPHAIITWKLDRSELSTHISKTIHGDNVTTSELRWTPSVRDGGRVLSCHAQSPVIQHPPLVDEWLLDVFYAPETILKPGRSLNLSNIEEGDDVYFECSIKAHPWVQHIAWLHENQELEHNVSSGVIISNQSLVLQGVTRAASGNYYCMAANVEGEGRSNPILLRVKFAPICANKEVVFHGAAKLEKVNIPCHLDSHPQPYAYKWTFNNSGESVNIPETHIVMDGSYSSVSYTPTSELDYGTILCWGTNAVGKQVLPCVFHVFPAGPPDPVSNCTVYNLSMDMVNVRCAAGFDGGLTQTFVLEVYEPRKNVLVANISSMVARFAIEDLPPAMQLTGVVYSSNEKGRSEMVSLKLYTLKDVAEKRTAAVKPPPPATIYPAKMHANDIIAVVIGVAGGLILVMLIICALLKIRFCRRSEGSKPKYVQDESSQGEPLSGDKSNSKLGEKDIPPPPAPPKEYDERNPDVIPLSDSDSWNVEAVHTISTASLPTSYATLPRSSRSCAHRNYQCCGGELQYTELFLSGSVAHKTPLSHHSQTICTTLDQRHHHPLYTVHHRHLSIPPPASATATPTHALDRPKQHRASIHSLHGGTAEHHALPQALPLARTHSLRRDPFLSGHILQDAEACVPLMAATEISNTRPVVGLCESVSTALPQLTSRDAEIVPVSSRDHEANVPPVTSQKESSV